MVRLTWEARDLVPSVMGYLQRRNLCLRTLIFPSSLLHPSQSELSTRCGTSGSLSLPYYVSLGSCCSTSLFSSEKRG